MSEFNESSRKLATVKSIKADISSVSIGQLLDSLQWSI